MIHFIGNRLVRVGCVVLLIGLANTASRAEVQFNPSGLPQLSDQPGEPFAVRSVVLIDQAGEQETVRAEADRYDLSEDGKRVEAIYPWGEVTCAYDLGDEGRRLDVRIEVGNTSKRTLHKVHLEAAQLKVGAGARGRSHHNIGAPTVLPIATAQRTMTVCNLDVERPLQVQVTKAGDDGIATIRVHAGGYRMVYDELYMHRPIAPGQTDSYTLSIRTDKPDANPHDLGQDIYKKFREAHPRLLDWPDRRPINRLFFRGGAPKEQIIAHYRDPENNPPPKPGNEKFQKGVIDGIERAVSAAKQSNAQGLIIWNIEGGSFPHPTTYIGDPRLVKIFNPDFDAVADEAFKLITDAGLHAGVCIRPTQIVYKPDEDTVGHRFTPVLEAHEKNPVVEQLGAKIKYARDRWGCTLFYVDTNFVWRPREPEGKWDAGMIQADVWRMLLKRFPDILIIPEFGYPEYFGLVGVYKEYDMGYRGTPERISRIYPRGFHVAVIEDADPHEKFDLMVRNVREGDSLMTFESRLHRNARAQMHIYKEAEIRDAGPPDALDQMGEAALIKLLHEGDTRGRFYAALTLADVGGEKAEAALRQIAADEQAPWLVRKNAIRALGERRDAQAVDLLVPLLKTRNPDLRHFAAEALGSIGRPAVKPLMQRLDQGDFYIRALGRTGQPEAADALIKRLQQTTGRNRRNVIAALGMVGGSDAVAELTEIVNNGKGYNRVAAANALADIATPEAVQALKEARATERAKPKDERWGHFIWAIGKALHRANR